MTRALVIAPQWIGDAVMTEPLLQRLHDRGEQLTVAALPWVAPVYRAMAQVNTVVELPFAHGGLQWQERSKVARQLQGQFEVAYVCPNSLKSALVPFLAHIPKRVGYLGEARVGLLTHRLSNPPKAHRPPMVAFYSALSGQTDLANDRPRLRLDPGLVTQTLTDLGLAPGQFHVMAPGAEFGPAKRWPTHHFATLAKQLTHTVVLLGSGKEADLCAEIATGAEIQAGTGSGVGPRVMNLAGKTSLAQALAVISAARSMVSNDSGLMHVAAGFGVRQVAVFGSSSPLHTPPLNPLATVIWLKNQPSYQPPLDCAPCFERVCPLGHTRCLEDVQAADVISFL